VETAALGLECVSFFFTSTLSWGLQCLYRHLHTCTSLCNTRLPALTATPQARRSSTQSAWTTSLPLVHDDHMLCKRTDLLTVTALQPHAFQAHSDNQGLTRRPQRPRHAQVHLASQLSHSLHSLNAPRFQSQQRWCTLACISGVWYTQAATKARNSIHTLDHTGAHYHLPHSTSL